MRAVGSMICLAVFVAGCAAAQQGPRSGNGDKLYEAVSAGDSPMLAVIDSRSHSADRRLSLGAPSADWKHVYTIVATSLVDTDPTIGATRKTIQLHGTYQLPRATANGVPGGLSPNGRWLVVERFDESAGQMPKASHMILIDTLTYSVRRQVDLSGYFQFDAVSDSGDNLYLIQHVNGREYYVRLYDVPSGLLTDNIVVDKSDGTQAMAGLRLSGVATPDGQWLFSMYVREHEAPFIHALSLVGPFAFCLDLPGDGYADDPGEMQWSLAMKRDGSLLYATNPVTGVVAVISTGANGAPDIIRTGRIDKSGGAGGTTQSVNTAVVSGNDVVVGGPAGVAWIDASSLKVRSRTLDGWHIASVGLSPDGHTLYAVSDAGRIAEIATGSAAVVGIFDPLAGKPMALMRVAAA